MNVFKMPYPEGDAVTHKITTVGQDGDCALEIGTAQIAAGQRVPEEGDGSHPHTEISIIMEGALDVMAGGKMHHLTAGDLVVVPALEPHYSFAHEDTRIVYAFLEKDTDSATA